jgi:hypothetical protein
MKNKIYPLQGITPCKLILTKVLTAFRFGMPRTPPEALNLIYNWFRPALCRHRLGRPNPRAFILNLVRSYFQWTGLNSPCNPIVGLYLVSFFFNCHDYSYGWLTPFT